MERPDCPSTSAHEHARSRWPKLIYSAITSLDGYITDEEGNFDWATLDQEGHSFVNDLKRPIGTHRNRPINTVQS